jgi:ribosomal protein S18 acetylase RimI-like enzyme
MEEEVAIRACTPQDADEVERLRVAGWVTAYRGIIADDFLDGLTGDVERRRTLMAERAEDVTEGVAVHAGEIVGWVVAGPGRDDDRVHPWQGEVYGCYVLPQWWGRGVGGKLLAYATQALGAAGRTDITLWVLEENHRARRFYESCGFHPEGKSQVLDIGGPVTEVRYRLRQSP